MGANAMVGVPNIEDFAVVPELVNIVGSLWVVGFCSIWHACPEIESKA